MVNYTPNLNLAMPILSDVADITVISANFDILDSALAKMVTTDSPQTISGSKTFTGTVIVNGHNLRNAVTTDETQTITGAKTFSNNMTFADKIIQFNTGRTGNCLHIQDRNITARATPPSSTTYTYPLVYKGQDGLVIGDMVMGFNSGGQSYTQLENYDKNGAVKSIILNLTGNPTSNTVVTRADVFGTNQVNNNLVHTISDEIVDGVKTFKQKIVTPLASQIWADYPAPRYNWVRVAKRNNLSNVHLDIEIQTTNVQFARVIAWIGGDTCLINKVIGVDVTNLGVAVGKDENNDTSIYIKVPTERNWTVRITSFDRYRNGMRMDVVTDVPANDNRATLPTISASVVF